MKHLCRRVKAEFGQSLHIPNDTGKLLVYFDNLKIDDLVKVCQELKDEQKLLKSSTGRHIISEVALKIRNDIQNQDNTQAWSPRVRSGKDEHHSYVSGRVSPDTPNR